MALQPLCNRRGTERRKNKKIKIKSKTISVNKHNDINSNLAPIFLILSKILVVNGMQSAIRD